MYVILINDDNTMVASKRERIVQRSKLVDTLWFLVPPTYQGKDMSDATVLLEYLLPVSKKYESVVLEKDDNGYEEYLKYVLPGNSAIDTNLTSEAGDIEMQLSFIYADVDIDGNEVQMVRKTAPTYKMTVVPLSAWSDIIPDNALSALDQRLIAVMAQSKANEELHKLLNESKADGMKYDEEDGTLQLTSGNKAIGNKVSINSCKGEVSENGVPIVELNDENGGETGNDEVDSIVEF